jgi:hypothetical protein
MEMATNVEEEEEEEDEAGRGTGRIEEAGRQTSSLLKLNLKDPLLFRCFPEWNQASRMKIGKYSGNSANLSN